MFLPVGQVAQELVIRVEPRHPGLFADPISVLLLLLNIDLPRLQLRDPLFHLVLERPLMHHPELLQVQVAVRVGVHIQIVVQRLQLRCRQRLLAGAQARHTLERFDVVQQLILVQIARVEGGVPFGDVEGVSDLVFQVHVVSPIEVGRHCPAAHQASLGPEQDHLVTLPARKEASYF